MKRVNFLTGIVGASALVILLIAPRGTVWAGDDDSPTTQTIKLFAVGNGSGVDDKSGAGCDTTLYPNLACFPGDTCGCLSGTATDFSGDGICTASITALEVSFDFDNASGPNGIPNGTIVDSSGPLAGRCYGASGFATITSGDSAGDTINLLVQGVVCDAIPGQPANNASFNGTYIIQGGTGPYAAATGTGSFTASIDNVNTAPSLSPMTFSATGSITALFSGDGSCGCSKDKSGDSDSNGDCHSNNHNGKGKG